MRPTYRRALLVLLIFGFIISSALSAQSTNKATIAIIELDGQGITRSEAAVLTERLRSELIRTGAFTVLERSKMDDILKEQGFQMTGCTSSECAIEIGKLLEVEQMVFGTLGRVGRTYTTDIRLVSIESGKIEKVISQDFIGDIDKMLLIMKNIASELTFSKQDKTKAEKVTQPTKKKRSMKAAKLHI